MAAFAVALVIATGSVPQRAAAQQVDIAAAQKRFQDGYTEVVVRQAVRAAYATFRL